MRYSSKHFLIIVLVVLQLIAAACGSGDTISDPSETVAPPAVTISSSALPNVGVTLMPAATNGVVAAAPTAERVMGPFSYPAGINPLTGLSTDATVLSRRPLAIKISNFPRYVRPQFGLSQADIVFEHYAEGGTTRFTAVYFSQNADKVGPIRSARLVDTVIPEMLKAALVASGSSTGVVRRLSAKSWFNLVVAEVTGYTCPPLCRESDDTNSLYTSTNAVRQALSAKGLDTAQDLKGLAFANTVPAGGAPATTLRIDYSGEAHTEWRYNSVSGKYERWNDVSATEVQAHFDAATNQPIDATNVAVLFISHVVDFNVPEDFDTDGYTGHFSTEIQLWTTGPAWVLRDGQLIQATWVRLHENDMVGFVDASNTPIPLRPGNTWFQLVGLTSEQANSGSSWIVRHKSPVDKGEIPGVPSPTPTLEGAPTETPTPAPTP